MWMLFPLVYLPPGGISWGEVGLLMAWQQLLFVLETSSACLPVPAYLPACCLGALTLSATVQVALSLLSKWPWAWLQRRKATEEWRGGNWAYIFGVTKTYMRSEVGLLPGSKLRLTLTWSLILYDITSWSCIFVATGSPTPDITGIWNGSFLHETRQAGILDFITLHSKVCHLCVLCVVCVVDLFSIRSIKTVSKSRGEELAMAGSHLGWKFWALGPPEDLS